jgi:hypothetical protein
MDWSWWQTWMTVVVCGIGGGLGGTLFVTGFEVPIPQLWSELLNNGKIRQLLFHLFRNTLSGGFAAWASWVLYTPVADITLGRPVNEQVILGAIITGGVGASLVAAILAGRAKDQALATKDQAIERLSESVEELSGYEPWLRHPTCSVNSPTS